MSERKVGQSTVVVRPAATTTLVRQVRLRVVEGPDEGLEFEMEGDKLSIGSHQGSDVVLTDRTVSRFHCEVFQTGDQVRIHDLDSSNGTVVDGVSVLRAILKDGSCLKIGSTKLKLAFGDSVALPVHGAGGFGSMVGGAPAMNRAFTLLEKASQSDANVLLLGETGTGKEVATEAVHEASKRCDGPLVVVDCGAIPSQLLESELFGHVKGAFTGAVTERPGAFREANGGTLFLDEIGELSLELQPKILRALERRHVKRVGEAKYETVDVRIIAATHRDLKSEVNRGRFRADLYYRLAVLEIRIPPLRERLEDIPQLVKRLVSAMGLAPDHTFAESLLEKSFLSDLTRHAWPGNVRELRNFLERCVALQEKAELTQLNEPVASGGDTLSIDPSVPLRIARDRWVATFERQYLEALLKAHDGNVSQSARAAGVNRAHMYRLLSRHELK